MKNKANKITLLYILFSAFLALVSFIVLNRFSYANDTELLYLSLAKDITFIILSGIIFKIILTKNDFQNRKIFEKLQETTEEIKD